MHDLERPDIGAISPLDGRYQSVVSVLREHFSEYALIRTRVEVEVRWFLFLSNSGVLPELSNFPEYEKKRLIEIVEKFSIEDAHEVKKIESKINHDVKAVEYFLKNHLSLNDPDVANCQEFIHFGCTSEDINNLSYALMIQRARDQVVLPAQQEITSVLTDMIKLTKAIPMLSHTHGQPASPTTVGKELANIHYRLSSAQKSWIEVPIMGKMNGAVGNFNAHHVAYPELNWVDVSKEFVESFSLTWNPMTTQIEPHDYIAQISQALCLYNTILIDFCRDVWGYIAISYFKQKTKSGEVGSSTMPHKVNPIDFENAEGNLGLANALFQHFAQTLPTSRWQRDLTDSTVLRNLGVAFAHSFLGYRSVLKGLHKLELDENTLSNDLNDNWEVLGEAIQTVMRRYGVEKPYEHLKELTRGKKLNRDLMVDFIKTLDIPVVEQSRLIELTPEKYIGYAQELSESFVNNADSV